jgi:hypothetical protein
VRVSLKEINGDMLFWEKSMEIEIRILLKYQGCFVQRRIDVWFELPEMLSVL